MFVNVFRKIKQIADKVTGDNVEFKLPQTQTNEAAALDLMTPEAFAMEPGQTKIVDTGLVMKAPRGQCFLILSRSGLAAKHGVFVLNSPGLIDRDYCGPNDTIKVILGSIGRETVKFEAGDRIAQIMLAPVHPIEWQEADKADFAKQDRGGLGSTGNK